MSEQKLKDDAGEIAQAFKDGGLVKISENKMIVKTVKKTPSWEISTYRIIDLEDPPENTELN